MKGMTYASGSPLLEIGLVTDRAEAETRLRNRDTEVLLVIPTDFSRAIQAMLQGQETVTTSVSFVGGKSETSCKKVRHGKRHQRPVF